MLVVRGDLPLLEDLADLHDLEWVVVLPPSGLNDSVSDFSSTSFPVVSIASLDEADSGFPESSSPVMSLARGTVAGLVGERHLVESFTSF